MASNARRGRRRQRSSTRSTFAMPLGAGDLSRCLGWGSGYPKGGGGESGRARVERFVQAAHRRRKVFVPRPPRPLQACVGDSDSQHSQQQLKFSQFQNYFSGC